MRRIAIKMLTASDLTLFEWHLRNQPAGKQKGINLNADVFIDELYPTIPELVEELGGAIPLDLSLFGPGLHGLHNLQRKIIKRGSYKNWRLDGEHIPQLVDRYAPLQPGDLAVVEFFGVTRPTGATLVLIGSTVSEDMELHKTLSEPLGKRSMISIEPAALEELINRAGPEEGHPIEEFLLAGPLEDAAEEGIAGYDRLRRRPGRGIGRDELRRAKKRAEEVGRLGEELLSTYFQSLQEEGRLKSHQWLSDEDALSPYDFSGVDAGGTRFLLDAKSTAGPFERMIHISLAELREMAASEARYDLFRLYEVTSEGGKLRICQDMRNFAQTLLDGLQLPEGVSVDSVSVDPSTLSFGAPLQIDVP